MGFNPNILNLEVGEITHLLSSDPNFQRDILGPNEVPPDFSPYPQNGRGATTSTPGFERGVGVKVSSDQLTTAYLLYIGDDTMGYLRAYH